jgi:translation initiation factor IF-2
VGNVAGCYVTSGGIKRSTKVRLIRDNIEIFSGKIGSLKRFKEDVSEVNQGYECGIALDGYNDVKVGDTIEALEIIEEARSL